tara:strand:- start:408 stop:989 length:582 start_codon:yes stop_codon:yes gene_type:complete
MSLINAYSVTIEDGVKKSEDYAPARKASVTLHGEIPEGREAEEVINIVSGLASRKVYEIIHNKIATGAIAASKVVSPPPADEPAAPVASDKDKLEAEAVKAVGGTGKFPAAAKAKPKAKAKAKAKPEPEEDGDEEITDLDLSTAITKKNSSLGKPQEISALLVKYEGRPAPKSVRDIVKDRRAEFLVELDALT